MSAMEALSSRSSSARSSRSVSAMRASASARRGGVQASSSALGIPAAPSAGIVRPSSSRPGSLRGVATTSSPPSPAPSALPSWPQTRRSKRAMEPTTSRMLSTRRSAVRSFLRSDRIASSIPVRRRNASAQRAMGGRPTPGAPAAASASAARSFCRSSSSRSRNPATARWAAAPMSAGPAASRASTNPMRCACASSTTFRTVVRPIPRAG